MLVDSDTTFPSTDPETGRRLNARTVHSEWKVSFNIEIISKFVKPGFDRQQKFLYHTNSVDFRIGNHSLKTFSTLLILFIGLNLGAAGLAADLCTGRSDCLYCSFQQTSHARDMPMDRGCCSTPAEGGCDFEKNKPTQLSVVYLIPATVTSPAFTNIAYPDSDMRLFDIDLKNRSLFPLLPQRKTAYQKTPLFIRHLSLIC